MSIKTKVVGLVALASLAAFAGPVSHFGKLVTCGGKLCGEKTGTSTPVQVKGPSLYWSTSFGAAFYTEEAVNWFVRDMNIGVIRAAMAIKYWDTNGQSPISMSDGNQAYTTDFGYLSSGANNKSKQKAMIETVIQAAIDNDIYVIVDWHSHRAHTETSDAVSFFKEMATKYKDTPNIIWEIYNEPIVSTSEVNSYASTVISAIRNTGNSNLIVVGSRKYSSYPYEQSRSTSGTNIAYTLHFYAGSHGIGGSDNDASQAVSKNVPVFVTEWGTTNYDGDGAPDEGSTSTWTSWMDQNKISSCNWFAGSDAQQSAMFPSGVSVSDLSDSKLSTSGKLFLAYMKKNNWTTYVPSSDPNANNASFTVTEGESKTLSTELGIKGTITSVSKPAVGEVTFTGTSITYKAAASGSPKTVAFTYEVKDGSKTVKGRVFADINRKPVVSDLKTSVSHKTQTKFSMVALKIEEPVSDGIKGLSFTSASAVRGTVTTKGDTLYYTPAGAGKDTITYGVKNANGTTTAKIFLTCENQAPSLYKKGSMGSWANTDPIYIPLKRYRAVDADGDSIWYKKYTKGDFPGTLELNGTGDTLIYTPAANKIGTVSVLAIVTDGELESNVGTVTIKLTGDGTSFDGTISEPTLENDPPPKKDDDSDDDGDDTPRKSDAVAPAALVVKNLQIHGDQVLVSLQRSTKVSLDVFDMNGHKVASLLNGVLSAGEHSVDMNRQALSNGAYILRMRYGSQMKTIRFISR